MSTDRSDGKCVHKQPMFALQESEFLKNALMVPWTLSTSQQPQQQIENSPDCNNPEFKHKVTNYDVSK